MMIIIMTALKIKDDAARNEETKNDCANFAIKHKGKRSLGRPEYKWLDDI
jgi:hypothetical protein